MKNYKKQTYTMRKLIFFLLLVIAVLPLQAKEDVTLTAEAPDVVVSGDQFRLTFTVNTQKGTDGTKPFATEQYTNH